MPTKRNPEINCTGARAIRHALEKGVQLYVQNPQKGWIRSFHPHIAKKQLERVESGLDGEHALQYYGVHIRRRTSTVSRSARVTSPALLRSRLATALKPLRRQSTEDGRCGGST